MELGASLGPYRIDRELGSGGMGRVYAATGPDGVVALKVVHPHMLETPGFFKRFMREAQLGQSIRHENVVRTLDCDQEFADGKPQCFLVMEYVEGQTLSALLGELEKVPEELCRHVAREICKGLAAIHEAGVVHRDLKPENVLITAAHVVKIMDLGVAQVADEALRLSKSGAFVGSVEYAAPEQFKSGDVDARTDLHALGVLLYELASGQHPYRGGGFHEVLTRVCETEPRRLGEVNPQLSAFFEEIVHTLLVKDPRGRFASATQLLSVLDEGEDSAWWHERARSLQEETKQPIRRIRIPRETAVYGRDAELAKLHSLFDRAKGGDGQVILIEGEAGIGKSRLVDELVARLHAEGEDLSFLFGSYPPGGAATAAGGFSSAFREQLGEAGSADYLTQTPSLVPAFDALLRGEPAPDGAAALSRDALGTCFVHATRNLAAESPTVVLIDDLHFAPDEARTLFMALAQAVPGHRVLLIGTTRPGLSEDWVANLTRLAQTSRIDVPRLGAKDLGLLLQETFHSTDLAHSLGMQIAMKSDGNPFFAFEIVRGLREGQFLTQNDDGTWASTRVIEDIQIPSSVLDLVNARVADLSEEERDILDVACCLGFEFDPLVVGDVLGLARIPLLKRLGQIERRHRLVRSSGLRYVFDHHQVQEALYGSLSGLLRREYHAALADALEARTQAAEKEPETLDGALCVDLCEHFLAGGRGESALRYLVPAQEHLRRGFLHAHVVALTERALAVPDLVAGPHRVEALLQLEHALDRLGRRERQEECVREAGRVADDTGDDRLRVRTTRALAGLLSSTSRTAESELEFRRALELARACGDRKEEADALNGVGLALRTLRRIAESREHLERSRDLYVELGERAGEGIATYNLGTTYHVEGRRAEAEEHYERALALFRETGSRAHLAMALQNVAMLLVDQGRLAEARESNERNLATYRELGDRHSESLALGSLGIVAISQCRYADAQRYLERQRALCRELRDREGEARAWGNLGNVHLAEGRLTESAEHHEQQLALSRELGDQMGAAIALVNLGWVWRELGDSVRARAALEESVALCREIGAGYPEGYGLLDLGRLADAEGDADETRRLVEASLALRRDIEHRDGVVDSLLELGELLLRWGDGDAARGAFEEALALAREEGRRPKIAHALCLLTRLPGGDADAAHAALAEAEETSSARACHLHLWKATGDREQLREATRLLDDLLSKNPPEHHESMRTNVRVNREILVAWREEFGDEGDAPDGASPGESPTRAG